MKDIYFIVENEKDIIKLFFARSDFMAHLELEKEKIEDTTRKLKCFGVGKKSNKTIIREIY